MCKAKLFGIVDEDDENDDEMIMFYVSRKMKTLFIRLHEIRVPSNSAKNRRAAPNRSMDSLL